MSYSQALKAAGAKVHAFENFGSYQGEWYALITYNGETGWIQGSFGSCSGCDAFEAEFGYDNDPWCNQHAYHPDADCKGCQIAKAKYDDKLANFGRPYVEGLQSAKTVLKTLTKQAKWDSDAQRAIDWISKTIQDFKG